MAIADNVKQFIQPMVEEMGYELANVTYGKVPTGMELVIYIYKKDGVTLDDCEKVSRAIDAPLDELNPTKDEMYTLIVSSVGLDYPMTLTRDFERNLGKEVCVKLYTPLNKQKEFVGILKAVNETEIEIATENGEIKLERKLIASCKLEIKF